MLVLLAALAFAGGTTAATAPMKQCDPADLAACFVDPERASDPFVVPVPGATRAAVLVHGLSDSPYFMKDVAQVLVDEGVAVLAIRLTGHGTDLEDLRDTEMADFEADVAWGVAEARSLADDVILGGFSLGGAVAWTHQVRHGDASALMLFSPALSANRFAKVLCAAPNDNVGAKDYGAYVRYPALPNRSACHLADYRREVVRKVEVDGHRVRPWNAVDVPLLLVYSEYDLAIDKALAKRAFRGVADRVAHTGAVVFVKGRPPRLPGTLLLRAVPPLPHASVLLREGPDVLTPEQNPDHDLLRAGLRLFLDSEVTE